MREIRVLHLASARRRKREKGVNIEIKKRWGVAFRTRKEGRRL